MVFLAEPSRPAALPPLGAGAELLRAAAMAMRAPGAPGARTRR